MTFAPPETTRLADSASPDAGASSSVASALHAHPALTRVDAGLARCARRLYGRATRPCVIEGDRVVCRFEEPDPTQAALQMHLRCGGHDYEVQIVDPQALAELAMALHPDVPEAFRNATLMHLLAPWRLALEGGIGQRIELVSSSLPTQTWRPTDGIGLRVSRHNGPTARTTTVRVRAHQAAGWRALAEAMPSLGLAADAPPDGRPIALSLTVSLRAEPVPLTLSELSHLECGDVLLMQGPSSLGVELTTSLHVRHQRLAGLQASLHGTRATITPAPAAPALQRHFSEANPMTHPALELNSEAHFSGGAGREAAPFAIDALRVDVDLELATLSLPLAALEALAVGQVFDTAQPVAGANVGLWCHGQRLGVGQLVAVGDRIGVRVTALCHIAPSGLPSSDMPAVPS